MFYRFTYSLSPPTHTHTQISLCSPILWRHFLNQGFFSLMTLAYVKLIEN